MDLYDFLAVRGIDIPDVLDELDAKVSLGVNDLVLAVGSLVEGLGNRKSDLDLFLITEKEVPAGETTIVVGRCLVDVSVLPVEEVLALADRLRAWANGGWNVTRAAKFTSAERTVLHRLRHGMRLSGQENPMLDDRMPSVIDVARLKLHVARQNSRTIQVDMVGYRETGDYRSLVFASQQLLGEAVDALLAGYGLTNPLVKWRSRLLDLLPEDWEAHLTLRPTGVSAGDRVWRLHRAPDWPEASASVQYALAISTFARAVFAWAERHMILGSPLASTLRWPSVRDVTDDAPLPFLDFDVDFALRVDGAEIGRLNEISASVKLSSREFAVALLCDGTTTACEAAMAVYGDDGDGLAASATLTLLQRADFCVNPPLVTAEGTRR